MSDTALSLQNVVKTFGEVKAINHLSLDISSREFFALLGPSGSGKTTLLRVIAGLEAPDSGQVLVSGQDVTRTAPYGRGIGMVFQDFLLFPHKKVRDNIIFPLRMQGVGKSERDDRLKWALGLLRLDGLEDRYPSQLSGGQQQRVALARGLISRPALLLLDEPLANLDRELRKEMEVELRRYQLELGIPFVYVTHNQEEALTMADRIAVMRGGIFEQVAEKHEVYTKPGTAFVAGFVGHSNTVRANVKSVSAGTGVLEWAGSSIRTPLPDGVSQGATVEYFVKCEHMSIVSAEGGTPAESHNFLKGRVRDVIFKGQVADYMVALADSTEVIVSDATQASGNRVRAGDSVSIVWPVEAGASFPTRGS
ncbi:MAG: ABC transporter ATP-binding protein [Rhodobacterales bacterium]|nr:ABC transporter ATP-binding protein [Rhodobacterales bacterium]